MADPIRNAMMRQVQKMQDDIAHQAGGAGEPRSTPAAASGEMVTVTMNGKHEITAVKHQARRPSTLMILKCLRI